MTSALVADLVGTLGAAAVRGGNDIDVAYGLDESLKAPAVRPAAVVFPSDTAQVSAALGIALKHRIAVTARGAGTGLSGACIPSPGGLVVSFERMASLLEID